MINKILGAVLIVVAIMAIIFIWKFSHYYMGADTLQRNFNECVSRFMQYQDAGCRALCKTTIDEYGLSLDANAIVINAAYQQESKLSAEWEEEIDYFGIYTYRHTFYREHVGKVPDLK